MRPSPDCIWLTMLNNQQADDNHQADYPNYAVEDQRLNGGNQLASRLSDGIDHNFQSSKLDSYSIHNRRSDWRVDGFSELIANRVRNGWTCYLVTIVFSQLSGPQRAVIHRMTDEVLRIYNTLLMWVHKRPKKMATDELTLL
jgi:hypothetical protein